MKRNKELIKAEINYVQKFLAGTMVSSERKIYERRLKDLQMELKEN